MIFLIPCFFSVFTDSVEKYIFYGQKKSVKKILFSTLEWGSQNFWCFNLLYVKKFLNLASKTVLLIFETQL